MNSPKNWKEMLRNEQNHLLSFLSIPSETEGQFVKPGDRVLSMDVQYSGEDAFVAMDLLNFPLDYQKTYLYKGSCSVPYVPGYFAFREGPVLLEAVENLLAQTEVSPNLLIIDGHGTAHPRKMGVASWLGIKLDMPSIGLAKDPLLKQEMNLGMGRGDVCGVFLENEKVGHALRSRKEVKPIYVSAGHKINQIGALMVAQSMLGEYRIIEPLRRADQAARAYAKNAPPKGSIILSSQI